MENDNKTAGNGTNTGIVQVLIVDDETGAINTLRGMLAQYCPQVTVVAAAFSVHEALSAVERFKPDLVFLDIEMPPMDSGFDFLKKCSDISFGVIFTTAYPKYAIQAINSVQPWAYLVKPYSVSELRSAVEVALRKIQAPLNPVAASRQGLIVPDSRKGNIVLRAGEIVYCRADGSFTDIYFLKNNRVEKVKSSRNLGEVEAELPEQLFCRTHHGYVVNLTYVQRLERTGRNGLLHLTCSADVVEVSVSKMEVFSQRLDSFLNR